MPHWTVGLTLALLVGCSGPRKVVLLDTGQGKPLLHVPRFSAKQVEVDEDEFRAAVAKHARAVLPIARPLEHARQLFGIPERAGWYGFDKGSRRLTSLEPEVPLQLELSPEDAELKRAYLLWCERTWGPGDCLRLLVDDPLLDSDDRYALAMAIAHGTVLGAMKQEFGRMVSPTAVVATLVGTLTMYAVLLALPEPVSKGVAALMTLGAVAYLGWDTVWRLIDGWLALMNEVDRAMTFGELRAAGEKFGTVMGERAARAFVMLATVAVGNTAAGMATKLPTLPGAGQAAAMAETQVGIRYSASALAQVESVAISTESVTLTLAPHAVAMAARGSRREVPMTGDRPTSYKSFKSMKDFKNALGAAGEGRNWHHIVEQTPGNVARFGPEALHNTKNVLAIDAKVHQQISAFYSSKQELTDNMVVREWLRGKSYEEQRTFGLEVLRQFGVNP